MVQEAYMTAEGVQIIRAGRYQNLMGVIKRVHSVVEKTDIEKHRQSQDYFGAILGNSRETETEDVDLDGMHAEWVRAARPHMGRNVILYCHGGGYSTGSSLYARTITTKLAATTSMDVFVFDYALAPEKPYPAGMNDAMKAWDYLMLLGYGARDVILAGDSAGGNMALSLTLKLKEESRLLPRGIVLMSPWTDLTGTSKSYRTRADKDPVLSEEYIRKMAEDYCAGQDVKNPLISPLFGDFRGFPPVNIQVGSNEILLNDSAALYKNMLKDSVSVHLEIFNGMWHVFQMSPFRNAYDAMNKNAEFIYRICS